MTDIIIQFIKDYYPSFKGWFKKSFSNPQYTLLLYIIISLHKKIDKLTRTS